jgi:hypothetical protein
VCYHYRTTTTTIHHHRVTITITSAPRTTNQKKRVDLFPPFVGFSFDTNSYVEFYLILKFEFQFQI